MAATLLSGTAFGAALVASGVYQPAVILGQLRFQDWHMIEAFLAATATSSLVVLLLDKAGHVRPQPRSASPLGLLGSYDGNVLGGALQGLGMALSGACAGTVIPQAANGIPSGLYALGGTFLGGVVWSGFLSGHVSRRAAAASASASTASKPAQPKLTVYERAGVGREAAFAAFETLCLSAAWAIALYGPDRSQAPFRPAVGGILIGLAQLVSMLSRKTMVGTSTAYEEAGKLFWWLVDGAKGAVPTLKNILFVTGMAVGARALTAAWPGFAPLPTARAEQVAPLVAAAGGFFLAVGSRVSGGCTSGHGISGMSMFSTSSFVTIGAMFGTAALLVPLFH